MTNPHPYLQSLVDAAPVASAKGNGAQPTTVPSWPSSSGEDVDVSVDCLSPLLKRRTLEVQTQAAFAVVDVTSSCQQLIEDTRLAEGSLVVYSPHTTCAVKINECETCFLEDLRGFIETLVPRSAYYRHDDFSVRDPGTLEGLARDEPLNGHSHIKQMLLGSASETVPVIEGELALGAWQRILFIELDQARSRRIRLQAHGWA